MVRWPRAEMALYGVTVRAEYSTPPGAPPLFHRSPGRYAIFQMAAAALPQEVFSGILGLINTLRGPPATAVPP